MPLRQGNHHLKHEMCTFCAGLHSLSSVSFGAHTFANVIYMKIVIVDELAMWMYKYVSSAENLYIILFAVTLTIFTNPKPISPTLP